jgi:hypothetical protein
MKRDFRWVGELFAAKSNLESWSVVLKATGSFWMKDGEPGCWLSRERGTNLAAKRTNQASDSQFLCCPSREGGQDANPDSRKMGMWSSEFFCDVSLY